MIVFCMPKNEQPFSSEAVEAFKAEHFENLSAFNVAFSASFWDCQEVVEVLKECDKIYTTQVKNWSRLVELFGRERIAVIPNAGSRLINFLKSELEDRYETVQAIDFSDLHKLHKKCVGER
jgi:hypothetical protein